MIQLSLLLEGRESLAYADLRRYYGFDLGDWLNGDDHTTIESVIAMLVSLPKQSAWSAHYTAERNSKRVEGGQEAIEPSVELTAEQELEREFLERQEWGDTDLHLAEIGNTLNALMAVIVRDKKFKPDPMGPDFMLSKEEVVARRKNRLEAYKKRQGATTKRANSLDAFYQNLGASATLTNE